MDYAEDISTCNEELAVGQFSRPRFRQPLSLRNSLGAGTVFEVEDDEEDWDLFEDYSVENYEEDTYELFQSYVPADTKMRVMEVDASKKESDHFETSENKSMALNMDEMEKQMMNLNDEGTVKKMIIKEGNGVKVPERCRIYFHYMSFASGYTTPLDTTLVRKYPHCTDLREEGPLLPGVELAVRSMELREASRFIVYPEMAFGERGCPPRVPPNVKILYIIETLQFIDEERLNTPLYMSVADRNALPFDELFEICRGLRNEGNKLYTQENLQFAIKKWRKSILILEEYPTADVDTNQKRADFLHAMYSNLAQAYLKLEKPAQACSACKIGLKLVDGQDSLKLLYRFAKAKFMLKDCDAALGLVEQGLRINKKDADFLNLEKEIRAEEQMQKITHKTMWSAIFKSKGKAYKEPPNAKLEKSEKNAKKGTPKPIPRSYSVITVMGEDEEARCKAQSSRKPDAKKFDVNRLRSLIPFDMEEDLPPYAYCSEEFRRNNLPLEGSAGAEGSTSILDSLPAAFFDLPDLNEENANVVGKGEKEEMKKKGGKKKVKKSGTEEE